MLRKRTVIAAAIIHSPEENLQEISFLDQTDIYKYKQDLEKTDAVGPTLDGWMAITPPKISTSNIQRFRQFSFKIPQKNDKCWSWMEPQSCLKSYKSQQYQRYGQKRSNGHIKRAQSQQYYSQELLSSSIDPQLCKFSKMSQKYSSSSPNTLIQNGTTDSQSIPKRKALEAVNYPILLQKDRAMSLARNSVKSVGKVRRLLKERFQNKKL